MNRVVALNTFAIIAIFLAASAVWSSDQGPSTQRIAQFENSHVNVWRSTIVPKTPLPLHRHDHGRVIIALQGGTMKIEEQSGTSETHVWETGKAYWQEPMPAGEMHKDANETGKTIELVVIEMK